MNLFKKIACLVLFIGFAFGLVACSLPSVDEETGDIILEGEDWQLNVGDKFDPFYGLTAKDAKGLDAFDALTVSHMVPLDENGCVTTSGKFQVKYLLEIGEIKQNLYRTVTVIFVIPETDKLIVNGDFELGTVDPFTKSEFDNGGCSLSVVKNGDNHEMCVDVTSVSWQVVSPRVETNVFQLENGKYYELSFKARSEEPRKVMVQIGQLLSAAPWFNALSDGNKCELETETKEFKIRFEADASIADLTSIQVLFGFGTIDEAAVATKVYMDDIVVAEVDAPVVESLLKVETVATELLEEGAAFEKAGTAGIWWDQGGWCGAPVEASISAVEGGLHIVSNQGKDACWFATQLFLASTILPAGNYTLSLKLEMSAAGTIQFKADKAANNAIKASEVEVSQGTNLLKLTFNSIEEGPIGLSMQFGTEALGNMGAFEATVSNILLVRNGDPVIVDYADPEHLFGTPTEVLNGGEGDATSHPGVFYVWYVQDAGWNCGPVVPQCEYSLQSNVLILQNTQTEENWWFATQIFYATKPFEAAGKHEFTCKLQSQLAGEITINGVKTTLVQGLNNISVPFEVAAGGHFLLSIQFGWEEINGEEHISHTLAGKNAVKLFEYSIDGQGLAEQPDPTEVPSFFGETVEVVTDGEEYAKSHPGTLVKWNDQNWCGSTVTSELTYNEGTITYNITSFEGTCWFGAQMFYYGPTVAKDARLIFILSTRNAGKIKLNGEYFDLTPGANKISVEFTAGTRAYLSFQAGSEDGGQLGAGSFIFTNFDLAYKEGTPETPEPQGNAFKLYTAGEGNNRNHIEGAGAWIWIQNESIGMSGESFGQFRVTVTCDQFNVVDAFFSDLNDNYVRLYVVLSGAPAADQELTLSITITCEDKVYTGTVTFLGTELK